MAYFTQSDDKQRPQFYLKNPLLIQELTWLYVLQETLSRMRGFGYWDTCSPWLELKQKRIFPLLRNAKSRQKFPEILVFQRSSCLHEKLSKVCLSESFPQNFRQILDIFC